MRLGLLFAPVFRFCAHAPEGALRPHAELWALTVGVSHAACGLLLLVAACGDREGAAGPALGGKLRACGLLGGGTVEARQRTELSECVAGCRLAASCDELSERYCDQTSSGQLLACESGCFDPIDCAGGKGTYTLLERCDGKPECEDGADEQGCGNVQQLPRYCEAGGERIWTFQRCNGIRDCKDGTDENNCPSEADLFVCTGRIPQRVRKGQLCDLVLDCLDGSDEAAAQGCAQLSCR